MKTFEAVGIICDSIDRNGNVVPRKECERIVDQVNQRSYPVLLNFDMTRVVGKTVSAYIEDNKVTFRFQLQNEILYNMLTELYAGPGFSAARVDVNLEFSKQGSTTIVSDCKMSCLGLIFQHADQGVTPIKEV